MSRLFFSLEKKLFLVFIVVYFIFYILLLFMTALTLSLSLESVGILVETIFYSIIIYNHLIKNLNSNLEMDPTKMEVIPPILLKPKIGVFHCLCSTPFTLHSIIICTE